jgi:hypothetical protein
LVAQIVFLPLQRTGTYLVVYKKKYMNDNKQCNQNASDGSTTRSSEKSMKDPSSQNMSSVNLDIQQ